jgi:type 1 fimbria pilin
MTEVGETMKETLTGHRHAWRTLACVLAALPMLVWGGPSATVTVKVTVLTQPCEINGGRPIEVEFDNVMTTEVGSDAYLKQVVYTLDCPQGAPTAMKLQIAGTGASFDSEVLQVKPDELGLLGIELRQGSTKLPINRWLNFTYSDSNKPELWAVPVKKSGTTLKGGDFTAAATMKMDYQ